jgi:arylsulfatase
MSRGIVPLILGLQSHLEDVPAGKATLRYEFEVTIPLQIKEGKGAGGNAQLYINDKLVGNAEFPRTTPIVFGMEGMSCGYDFGDCVTEEYETPFRFTGRIKQVTVNVSGDLIQDDEAEIRPSWPGNKLSQYSVPEKFCPISAL